MPHAPQVQHGTTESSSTRQPALTWPWLLAAALIVPLVVFLQQYTLSLESVTLEHAPREKVESEEPLEPGIGPLLVQSKIIVRVMSEVRRFGVTLDEDDQAEVGRMVDEIDHDAVSRIDRLRAAIVAGDVFGGFSARERLTRLQSEAAPDGDLSREIQWLLKVYTSKPAAALSGPDPLPEEVRAALIDRHGWFGRLALAYGKPEWDRDRRELTHSISGIGRVIRWIDIASYVSYAIGAILLFGVVQLIRQGELESLYEEEGGGDHRLIYLEVFTIFVGGFLFSLGMHLFMFGMGAEAAPGTIAFLEVLNWVLVAVVAWPLIRTVPWRDFAEGVGLTRGEGVGVEIGYGVMAFLAWMPVLFLISLILGAIERASEGQSEASGGFPLFEPPRVNGWTMEWIEVIGAVVWAPFLEEVVFRGALFKFLHPYLKVWGTVLVTAVIFGMIHPYSPLGLIDVGCMGVFLGFLRQWRGSLVAGMTVHFLHNGLISVINLLYLSSLG